MNFLAHLLLARSDPASRVGSLLPDLVRGPLPRGMDAEVFEAVHHHRLIDRRTDAHPATARSVSLLRERYGRLSGVLVDLFYDHFLAADWPGHCRQTLDDFTHEVYADLRTHDAAGVPASVDPIFQRMARQDWLGSYATLDGIELTLWRMSRRLSDRLERLIRLAPAVDELSAHYDRLAADFAELWRDLAPLAADGSAIRSEPLRETTL